MLLHPGPKNLITDVPGIKVGNAEDSEALTGTTVILADRPAIAAVDVRGGAPGTRETDMLASESTVERVDAITLSGGSAFGLDAAGGVMQWLAGQGRGFSVGEARIPIVPAAILFDLLNGGNKGWDGAPPYRSLGIEACEKAGTDFMLGNAGAGLGAQAGDLKGGLGSCSLVDEQLGYTIGALAAVNAVGSAVMPDQTTLWAWPFERDGELGRQQPPGKQEPPVPDMPQKRPLRAATTLVTIATDAPLSQPQAKRVAVMAQDGFARALHPVHSPLDGDIVFVLSTAREEDHSELLDPWDLSRLGAGAADCVARAIARGVFEAKSLGGVPAYRDIR